MRYSGSLISWKDERGFGFIAVDQDQSQVFVHISAFPCAAGRPQLQQKFQFEIEETADGKKRAIKLVLLQANSAIQAPEPSNENAKGSSFAAKASWVVLLGFALLWLFIAIKWQVWSGFYLVYAVMSGFCYLLYGRDKKAAIAGQWRTQEDALILLGFLCGWPGAILAQQFLRHKTSKIEFQLLFWISVVLNILIFLGLNYFWLQATSMR